MWSQIQQFVMSWSDVSFYLVFTIFALCLIYCFLLFIKSGYGSKKMGKVKWSVVVMAAALAVLIAVLSAARWA